MLNLTFLQVAVTFGGVCPAGFICPQGTKHPQQHPCPVGTFSQTLGAHNLSSCWPCPPGLYCNSTGLTQPSGICETGRTQDKRRKRFCQQYNYLCVLSQCMPIFGHTGYYCSGGTGSPMPTDGVTGDICPVGYFCPMGSAYPLLCPDGTYSNTTGV